MSRVSMELLLRLLLLLQLESIGPPKKEYFCKIKFRQLAFKKLSKILGSKSEMRSQIVENLREIQIRVKKLFGYPGTHWYLGIKIYLQELFGWCNSTNLVGLKSYRKSKFEISKSESAEIQVCSCVVGYTENQKFDLLQDEFQKNLPIIILPMRVMFNSNARPRVVSNLKKRLRNFDVTTYYPTYLKFWKCAESSSSLLCVFAIMVEKFKFPAVVGYLPWPTASFKKFKTKIAHTKSKKSAKLLYYIFISPVGLVLCLSIIPQLSSVVTSLPFPAAAMVVTCISRSFLGFKKTGCRRRNVLKEDLVAEDKTRKLVSSLWARLPGYGQKRPRYQWVPGYPMV